MDANGRKSFLTAEGAEGAEAKVVLTLGVKIVVEMGLTQSVETLNE